MLINSLYILGNDYLLLILMLTRLLQLFSQLMVLKLYTYAVTGLILFIALEQIYSVQ